MTVARRVTPWLTTERATHLANRAGIDHTLASLREKRKRVEDLMAMGMSEADAWKLIWYQYRDEIDGPGT